MKTWASAATCLACLACLLSAGCNPPRQRVSRLEDEMRRLESTLWDKEYELEKSQRELGDLRAKLGEAGGSNLPPTPGAGPSIDPGYNPPVITLPDQSTQPGEIPDRFRIPSGPGSYESEAPPFQAPEISPPNDDGFDIPPPATSGLPDLNSPSAPMPQDSTLSTRFSALTTRVTGVTLDPDLSVGDTGLTVVVQPRDAAGQIVPTPGAISVVLIDPTLAAQGNVARVARWDFTAEQVAQRWASGSLSLLMAWPDSRPSNERLHTFVRYTTDDGRRVEADREITPQSTWQHNPAPPAPPAKPTAPSVATRPTWSPTR